MTLFVLFVITWYVTRDSQLLNLCSRLRFFWMHLVQVRHADKQVTMSLTNRRASMSMSFHSCWPLSVQAVASLPEILQSRWSVDRRTVLTVAATVVTGWDGCHKKVPQKRVPLFHCFLLGSHQIRPNLANTLQQSNSFAHKANYRQGGRTVCLGLKGTLIWTFFFVFAGLWKSQPLAERAADSCHWHGRCRLMEVVFKKDVKETTVWGKNVKPTWTTLCVHFCGTNIRQVFENFVAYCWCVAKNDKHQPRFHPAEVTHGFVVVKKRLQNRGLHRLFYVFGGRRRERGRSFWKSVHGHFPGLPWNYGGWFYGSSRNLGCLRSLRPWWITCWRPEMWSSSPLPAP